MQVGLPLLGLISTSEVAINYLNATNYMVTLNLLSCHKPLTLVSCHKLPVSFVLSQTTFVICNVTSQFQSLPYLQFLGGLIMAIAVEHCGLHNRVALRIIMMVGLVTASSWESSLNWASWRCVKTCLIILLLGEVWLAHHRVSD